MIKHIVFKLLGNAYFQPEIISTCDQIPRDQILNGKIRELLTDQG